MLDETFNASCPGIPANWVEYNSALDLISCDSDELIDFNGFGVGAGESWLVTPQLNFVNANYLMNFDYVKRFSGPEPEILFSLDYDGSADPTAFTWTTLTTAEAAVAQVHQVIHL